MGTLQLPPRVVEPSMVSDGACLSFGAYWGQGQRTGDLGFPCSFHSDTGLLALFSSPMYLGLLFSLPLILTGRK